MMDGEKFDIPPDIQKIYDEEYEELGGKFTAMLARARELIGEGPGAELRESAVISLGNQIASQLMSTAIANLLMLRPQYGFQGAWTAAVLDIQERAIAGYNQLAEMAANSSPTVQ